SEPVMVSPPERNLVLRIDGRKTVEEIARELDSSSFETAKTLYGLITAGLVEMRPGEAARPSATAAAPGGLDGDEKKILSILCARVKQESETALGESNLTAIERPYKQALLEIERGRGVEAVRDLIRQTEKTISALGGPSKMRSFQDKMSLVIQPKA
ncbi:MAG TPA: hypothetical protein VN971_08345, partial [Thermoanaerobaculia bacterium]|nr:hypothetical protein [Thermoanaerobaculia bacterium]